MCKMHKSFYDKVYILFIITIGSGYNELMTIIVLCTKVLNNYYIYLSFVFDIKFCKLIIHFSLIIYIT